MVNETCLNEKIKTLAIKDKIKKLPTKAKLRAEKNKTVKLQAFNSIYFSGKSHFKNGGTQNYLVFQPIFRYFKNIGNTDNISTWKSKGLSDETIKSPTTSDNSLAPSLNYIGFRLRIKFDGQCLKQDKVTFNHKTIVNIYIVHEIN